MVITSGVRPVWGSLERIPWGLHFKADVSLLTFFAIIWRLRFILTFLVENTRSDWMLSVHYKFWLAFLVILIFFENVLRFLRSARPLTFGLSVRIVFYASTKRRHYSRLDKLWVILAHRSSLELFILDFGPLFSGHRSDHTRLLAFKFMQLKHYFVFIESQTWIHCLYYFPRQSLLWRVIFLRHLDVLLQRQTESAEGVIVIGDEMIAFYFVKSLFDLFYLTRPHLLVKFLLTHGLDVIKDSLELDGSFVHLSRVCSLRTFLHFLTRS